MRSGRSALSPAAHDAKGLAWRSIGAELQAARFERGEDLKDISAYLRIRPAFLAALESGDTTVMPERPYLTGFLRSYADYLGLNGDGLVARLKTSGGEVRSGRAAGHCDRTSDRRVPLAAVLLVSGVMLALASAGYRYGDTTPRASLVVLMEKKPEAGVPPTPTTTETSAYVSSAVAAEPGSPAILISDDGETAVGFIGVTDPGRLALRARSSSWIQLRSADRTFVRSGILQPGERVGLPGRMDLAISTANAGGVEVLLDEHSLGALGAADEIVRDLPINPDDLKRRMGRAN